MPRTEPFDNYSDRYDAWFEKNSAVYRAELETIRQILPSPGGMGLEVGVGSGKFAAPLGISIGVEPSEQMARKAERLNIQVFRGVAEDLPFPNDQFDFVLMVTTICFVDDVLASFREAFRVLKPGGSIVVGFVDKESELGKRYLEKRNTSVFYQEAVFFSTPEVCQYLRDAGFDDLTFKQTLIPSEKEGTIREGFGQGAFVAVKGIKRAGN